MENGIRYAYTGNFHDEEGDTTLCHECGTRCAGVFEARPGTWGRKRKPVFLGDFRKTA